MAVGFSARLFRPFLASLRVLPSLKKQLEHSGVAAAAFSFHGLIIQNSLKVAPKKSRISTRKRDRHPEIQPPQGRSDSRASKLTGFSGPLGPDADDITGFVRVKISDSS